MKKLKIILHSNCFYYILFIISVLYVLVNINWIDKNKVYDFNDKVVRGYVNDYFIDGNKLSIVLKSKYKMIINYYFSSEKEKNNFSVQYGDYIEVEGDIDKPKENSNFNLFNYKRYLKSKRINYIISASNIKILRENNNIFYKIKNKIVGKIENNVTSSYLKTFILGDKRNIDDNILSSYQKLGISHLFAISGMHVSFLSILLLKALKKFDKKLRYIFVIVFLLFYLFLTNYTVSIVRATFQFILFSINKIFDLKIKNINIVLFIISILLFYNPFYLYDSGFLFSFSISFNLILINPVIRNINNYLFKSLIISLVSFLVSLPILINNYYEVNFLSIIYNIFFIPFVSFILFPLNLLTLFFSFLDPINNIIINIFENIILYLTDIKLFTFSFSKLNLFFIVVYYIVFYFCLFKCSRKYIKLLLIIMIFFINKNRFVFTPSITFIDVGQGDSILIRIYDKNILIDTGGKIEYEQDTWKKKRKEYNLSDAVLLPYLKSVGVKKINYLILTHGDFDHMGESINLVNNFKVDKVIFNCGSYNDLEQDLIKKLKQKNIKYYSCIKELNIDKYKLQFLNTKEYDNENDNSNVIYTEINGYKILFMGDAGIEKEKDVLENYNISDIDVLKVGHHGSNTSSSNSFIDGINPKYSIISVGKNNRYGHPKESVLDTLKSSKIYRTDIDGSIKIKLNKNGYMIRTCPP